MTGGGVSADGPAARLVARGVLDRLQRLASELRAAGAEIALSEVLDAAEALRHVDLGRRAELRAALRCVLVKYPHQDARFDAAFDRAFPARPSGPGPPTVGLDADDLAAAPATAPEGVPGPLDARIRDAVDGAALEDLRLVAEEAVERHGGFDEGVRTERYHVYRVLRAIDLARLLHEAIRRARDRGEPVERAEVSARVEALRRLVTEQVRARLAGRPGTPADGPMPSALDVDIVHASAAQLDDMREAVRPLVRRLAARLRLRRQTVRTGRVDMRRTARRSVGTGGVPLDVVYRRPRAHKPELFSLCDVSGSVADFAGFTLTLISALAGELAGTRTFAFVDAVDEITEIVERATTPVEPWQILQRGRVLGADGHSDYGAVLSGFWEGYGRAGLTHRTTVVIAGDARSNYRPERADLLGTMARRARAIYWFDPEPRAEWNSTDSVIGAYAPYCDRVFEVRTLRQLAAAVEAIL
jgi:uncharacterized protein with von Willebrand factor type A (vWA) domain